MPHSLSPYSNPPIIPLSLSLSFSCHLSQFSQSQFTSRRQVQVRSAETQEILMHNALEEKSDFTLFHFGLRYIKPI